MFDSLPLRIANAVASAAIVALACVIYVAVPYWRSLLAVRYGWVGFPFTGLAFLAVAASAYVALLAIYYLVVPKPATSKSLRFWAVLARFAQAPAATLRHGLTPEDRLAVLATLVKAFFGPMMVIILLRSFMGGFQEGWQIFAGARGSRDFLELFNRHGFWFAMNIIIFVDVSVFTAGYLVEARSLKNEIRSVEPTLLGWTAALLCYYPFNNFTGMILGRQVSDFPQFDDPTAHLALNALLLLLMAIYAGASVALGLKGSNLTHRGIVSRGPYRWVRHPAYVCKNMAWWIGAIPSVSHAFGISWFSGITAIASVAGWSTLYVLRAVTEEDHLRGVDGEYAAYAQKVRYRFIPGVI